MQWLFRLAQNLKNTKIYVRFVKSVKYVISCPFAKRTCEFARQITKYAILRNEKFPYSNVRFFRKRVTIKNQNCRCAFSRQTCERSKFRVCFGLFRVCFATFSRFAPDLDRRSVYRAQHVCTRQFYICNYVPEISSESAKRRNGRTVRESVAGRDDGNWWRPRAAAAFRSAKRSDVEYYYYYCCCYYYSLADAVQSIIHIRQ